MDTFPNSAHTQPRAAIFLDRDGVINRKMPEDHYIRDISEFEFLPGALDAMAILVELGFALVVVTNQRGIARDMMTEDELIEVHRHMQSEGLKRGVRFDGIYHCPHETFEQCACRKPEPGMILAAAHDLHVDLARSYMVGDAASDVQAGKRAGVTAVRITNGEDCHADMVFPTLLDFALHLKEAAGKESRAGS